MRLRPSDHLWSALAVAISLLFSGLSASAATDDGESSAGVRGRTLDVSARIFGGRYSGGSGGNSTCQYSNDPERIRGLMPEEYPDGPLPADELARTVNGVQEIQYVRVCHSPTIFDSIWVPQITATDLLPALYDAMRAQLESPQVQFKGLDPEFGWAYVTVPFGFRVGNTGPVSVTARVSFGPLFVWATMTARPDAITFDPGEPGGRSVTCSAAGAAATGFDSERPSECSYTYSHSSSVASGGRTFVITTEMTYQISYESSSGAGTFPAVTTTSSADLAVAEVQALVTCTGPRPEQGGCSG
jgi:hypothetical protein